MEEIISAIFEGIFDLIGASVKSKKTKAFLYIITIIIMIAIIIGLSALAGLVVNAFKSNPARTITIASAIILLIILIIMICLIAKKRKNK
ncbi:MAG: hypothetical protein NC213_02880 [Acetobacter sp.]|nr:hypothetical protein [Bacteroides sp.]MCM1340666.1 hypothetical protein [Acetobacter sp.]MCM1433777.1 hypothetical protein [Clostridiales bacterium]